MSSKTKNLAQQICIKKSLNKSCLTEVTSLLPVSGMRGVNSVSEEPALDCRAELEPEVRDAVVVVVFRRATWLESAARGVAARQIEH